MGEEKKTQKDVIQTMREMNAQVIKRLFPFFEFLIDFLFFFFSSFNCYMAQLNPIFNPLG